MYACMHVLSHAELILCISYIPSSSASCVIIPFWLEIYGDKPVPDPIVVNSCALSRPPSSRHRISIFA